MEEQKKARVFSREFKLGAVRRMQAGAVDAGVVMRHVTQVGSETTSSALPIGTQIRRPLDVILSQELCVSRLHLWSRTIFGAVWEILTTRLTRLLKRSSTRDRSHRRFAPIMAQSFARAGFNPSATNEGYGSITSSRTSRCRMASLKTSTDDCATNA